MYFRDAFVVIVSRCDVKAPRVGEGVVDDGARVDLHEAAARLLLVPDDWVVEGAEPGPAHAARQGHVVALAKVQSLAL